MTPADMLTFDNTTQPITEWALDYGITAKIIIARLNRGWSTEQAITIPMRAVPNQKVISPELERYIKRNPRLNRSEKKKEALRKSKKLRYTGFGETRSLDDWAKIVGISSQTLRIRIYDGMSVEDALTCPLKRSGRRKAKVKISAGGGEELCK